MGKNQKRRIIGGPGPENLAARATGKVVTVPRLHALARVMDTAIWLWFFEKDLLSIHLLIWASYRCLQDLGKKSEKGPRLETQIGDQQFAAAYDFLRHASSNPNVVIDFVPSINAPVLFDAVAAFNRIFGNLTLYMRAFRVYFALHPEGLTPDSMKRLLERAGEL